MITPALIAMFAAARASAAPPPPGPAPVPSPPAQVIAHFDGDFTNSGTVGSYTITDLGGGTTTAQAKFGSGSATGGFGGEAQITPSPALALTGDWVMDGWVRDIYMGMRLRHADGNQEWQAFVTSAASGISRYDDAGDPIFDVVGTQVLASGTWTHVEFSRVSGTVRLFVNGVLSASQSDAASLDVSTVYINGETYLDEWRFINGAGGHTAGFTPPSGPWV